MTDQEFLILLEKYRQNQLDQEGVQYLMQEIAAGRRHALIQDDILRTIETMEVSDSTLTTEDQEQILSVLLGNIRPSRPGPLLLRYRWPAAAALVLLILTAAAFYFWQSPLKTAAPRAAAAAGSPDAEPGTNKALLTLANGAVVELDSSRTGPIPTQGNASVQSRPGQLVYHQTASAAPASISYNLLRTPKGGQYQLVLPDGTKVWLNAASSLRFPTQFTEATRSVELTGEAYFEVAGNAAQPFHVKVAGMDLTVLGTRFNIMAYTDEQAIRTTLLEGAVKVTAGKEERLLKPGQQSQLEAGNSIQVINDADIELAIAWKNGFTSFRSADIRTIMRQVMRWYNIEVVYEGEIPERVFTGDIPRDARLSELLQLLEVSKIHFQMNNDRLVVMP
ncbi:FecR domain-containing protein [uncultured Chitinophaga sp.]|jgi:Fe2+-dicitrate sensor, membrane component|uniref:FecR family protein n=1 Tax=uncultured Chitinophaga sp. TaxID=339340 RepID=UPI0026262D95|nr:FecR domain-containing protein [uncultured Chitinophaga sp.]